MKLADPLDFCRRASTAPALNRGLAALGLLGEEGKPLSLEIMASRLRLPKASLFRLLDTLQNLGLVRKTPDKWYEALWALQPLRDPRLAHRHTIECHLPNLCAATGCTVEWYEPAADGMVLTLQSHPDSELRVQARPGFVRRWNEEFEAVARLGYAFASQAPELSSPGVYVANGRFRLLGRATARRYLTEARARRQAEDEFFNSNGVRRCAVAVFSEPEDEFLGVLALAEVCHFSNRPPARSFLPTLAALLNS